MGLVTVELDVVVGEVVLMANLSAVVGERPVEELVDPADEANVIIDRALVIRGTGQRPVESIHSSGVTGDAVQDLRSI